MSYTSCRHSKAPFTQYNLLSNRFDNLVKCLYTRYNNRLSNPFSNRLSHQFDKRLHRVYTAGCQTGCTTRFDNRLNEQWLFVQPVVKPCLSNRLYNRFDNRLYLVNGV